jgi:hypothetical protein
MTEETTPIDERLLKQVHSSLLVTFGTNAPYALGKVSAAKIGFASTPVVTVSVWCQQHVVGALVPVVRQRVYRELAERGWTPDDIDFCPSLGGSYRWRLFTDENPASPSCGKRKRGCALELHFEMGHELAEVAFPRWAGSFQALPENPYRGETRRDGNEG